MNNKEFHLYLDKRPENSIDVFDEVTALIELGISPIHTTQVYACTTYLFDQGYRIFVHDNDGEFEITLGPCERTERIIKMGYNLPKLIVAGEFDLRR